MGTKKSVDDIWRELNARPAPRGGGNLSGISNLPGITTKIKTVGLSAPVPTKAMGPDVGDAAWNACAEAAKLPQYDPAKAGATAEEVQSYTASIQRTINCLTDPDRSLRRSAASTLHTKLFTGDPATPRASAPVLQALLCGPLLHPLLMMLGDSVERCRTTALSIFLGAVRQIADVSPLLPALMPALFKRFGELPVQETAEEIRLQVMDLTSLVVNRAEPKDLALFADDACTILCRALEDNYHDIKKAACTCLTVLAARAPAGSLDAHSEKLLQGIVGNLLHPHSRVRLACIQALDALVVAGVPAGQVESVVAPGVKAVAYDRAPAVREALFEALAHWLGYSAPAAGAAGGAADTATPAPSPSPAPSGDPAADAARSQAYAPVLLPLLLVGVTDPQASTAETALALVEGVGEVWQAARARQANGRAAAGVDSKGPVAMEVDSSSSSAAAGTAPASNGDTEMAPATQSGRAHGDGAEASSGSSSSAEATLAACQLRPPYSGRPGPGCRALVRALLAALLPPLVRELGEWTVALRSAAARGLHTTLVLAEAAATDHLQQLVPALCSAIGDEDAEVAGHVMSCVHVVGAHVAAAYVLPLALDHLTSGRLSLPQKANTLVVLSGLMHAAGRAQQQLPDQLLLQVASALSSEDVLGTADHAASRQQLLAVAVNLMTWAGPRCAAAALQLYLLLLQLYGSETQGDAARQAALQGAMAQLASCCGAASFDALAAVHADAVLSTALASGQAAAGAGGGVPAWASADAPGFRLFRALLLTASGPTLARLAPSLTKALSPLLSEHECDGNLRVAVLNLLDTLLEDPTRGPALAGSSNSSSSASTSAADAGNSSDATTATSAALLRDLLVPPLVWRAGKVAAAVRFAAITAWSTLLGRRLPPVSALTTLVDDGTLLPLLQQAMDEDWYVDLRASACYVMEQLLQMLGDRLGAAPRRAVYPELLKRLDDSNNNVRCAACRALVAFVEGAGPAYCDTNSGYLAAGVVIHMDDSDPRVQEAACSVLEAQAARKPRVVAVEISKVRERFRSKHYCDRVLAVCSGAAAGAGDL